MKITETNLTFNGTPKRRSSTKRIIIHHSASGDVSASTIHGWHLGQGWLGIGYQFVIRAGGTVERGRVEWSIGSHSGPGGNGDSIGICLAGNFETGKPTEAQLAALVELIQYLRGKYGDLFVIGHKDVMATACPGKHFPWVELQKRLEERPMAEDWKRNIISDGMAAGILTEYHEPDQPVTKWFVVALVLNAMKILRGEKK